MLIASFSQFDRLTTCRALVCRIANYPVPPFRQSRFHVLMAWSRLGEGNETTQVHHVAWRHCSGMAARGARAAAEDAPAGSFSVTQTAVRAQSPSTETFSPALAQLGEIFDDNRIPRLLALDVLCAGRDTQIQIGERLLRQPGGSKGAPHLLAIGRAEAPHPVIGISLADGELRLHLQQRSDMRSRFIDLAEERQRVCQLEMTEPELLDERLPKCVQGQRIFAAEPVPLCGRPPPPARRARCRQSDPLFGKRGAFLPKAGRGHEHPERS